MPNRYVHNHHSRRKWEDVATPIADPVTGCLRWQGSHSSDGYGLLNQQYAHRLAYEAAHGAISDGLDIDHVYERGCRYKDCVNVAHLEAVTHEENIRRWGRSVTLCPYGHEYTVRPNGRKRCLPCHATRERKRRKRGVE